MTAHSLTTVVLYCFCNNEKINICLLGDLREQWASDMWTQAKCLHLGRYCSENHLYIIYLRGKAIYVPS